MGKDDASNLLLSLNDTRLLVRQKGAQPGFPWRDLPPAALAVQKCPIACGAGGDPVPLRGVALLAPAR